MGVLELSFYGPFFYIFGKDPAKGVDIYAPKCIGHKAGIFTPMSEFPLRGQARNGDKYSYTLGGDVFTPPSSLLPPVFYNPQLISTPDQNAKFCLSESSFHLWVTSPQVVYAINKTTAEIVKGDLASGQLQDWATGLRFLYDADFSKGQKLTLKCPDGYSWNTPFDTPYAKSDHADVFVRYSSDAVEDQDHDDAKDCFERIAGLCGHKWWLSYDDINQPGSTPPLARAGSDCRAPALARLPA